MKYLILIIAMLVLGAHAQPPDFINLGGVSYHYTERNGPKHRDTNAGIGLTWSGVEAPVLGTVDASVGGYENSQDRVTVYAAAHKLPFDVAGGKAGITVALATGYRMAAVVPVVAPTICWRPACVVVTPPLGRQAAGAVSIQFRIPI